MKEIQKAREIEQSIATSPDSQILSPEKKAEVNQFKKQLEAAIVALKNSKLGKGRSSKAALYKLPWYMIIGPSAAGKTTAIQNSGLEFPYRKDSIKGVGGTRNCDWFFSNRAIFLDTAGRYITESEDRAEWLIFLETLKKNRKKKPINGVIVALNIDEIINSEDAQLYNHAKNIRIRIDELIQNLGIVFPVYLIFTKCDLIQGFIEFFGDFSETERSQIWGATLNFQQQNDPNPKKVFESEFDKLADVIIRGRSFKLSNPLKREQRRKVYLFPFQFISLKAKLTYLIGEVFQPNPYQDNPLFRGFYFTSGTQEGIPLDLAIREIAKKFNLPPVQDEEKEELFETKSYFIKDLINDVVINDQFFGAGQVSTVIKQNRLLRLGTVTFSAIMITIIGFLIILGFLGSSDALDNIASSANLFNSINLQGDLLHNFTEIESFRQLIQKVEKNEFNQSFITFGLDRTKATSVKLNHIYLNKTQPFFEENIFDEINSALENYIKGGDYTADEIYKYLKTYLLIGDERAKLDTINQVYLTKVFTEILDAKFIDPNYNVSSKQKDSLKILFNYYSAYIAKQMEDSKIYSYDSKNNLVNLVRAKYQYRPNADNIYTRLKENGRLQFPGELTLENLTNGKSGQLLNNDFKILEIFSAQCWQNYFQPAINRESSNPGGEDWVIGKSSDRQLESSKLNSEELKTQLSILYIGDFLQNWIRFLQNIRYTGFESVSYSSNSLKLLSDPTSSPLLIVLNIFSDNLKTIADDFYSDSINYSQTNVFPTLKSDVQRILKFLVLPGDGTVEPEIIIVIKQYGILSKILEGIDGGEAAKEYSTKLINLQVSDFQAANNTILNAAFNFPEIENVLTDPLDLSLRSIFSDATSYLNQLWKSQVVEFYNTRLANSFPFAESENDAPIGDFEEFFKPQTGIFWSFFDTELRSFVKLSGKKFQKGNEGINFSNDFIASINKATDISTTLFKNGSLTISFTLKPQFPVSRITGKNTNLRQQSLMIDGEEQIYKLGGSPSETNYTWPSGKGASNAILSITHIEYEYGLDELKYNGKWALFRLIKHASVTKSGTSSQLILTWNFSKPEKYSIDISYVLDAGSSKHPFSTNFFKSFTIPEKLN